MWDSLEKLWYIIISLLILQYKSSLVFFVFLECSCWEVSLQCSKPLGNNWLLNFCFFDGTGLVTLVLALFLFVGCAARPFYPLPSRFPGEIRQPLETNSPYNIAHRGSNGEFPEETLPAYKVGISTFIYSPNILFTWFLKLFRTWWGYQLLPAHNRHLKVQ